MTSVVEDFEFIAKRVSEIRSARYHELGVSPPAPPEQPQSVPQDDASAASGPGGLRSSPSYEHLAVEISPTDDWDCCLSG